MPAIASRKDETILTALLTHTTVKAAAKSIGISESSVYSRLKDAEFKARYDALRREMLSQVTAGLQGKLAAAVDTIESVMSNPAVSPQTRLNAASEMIRDCMKLTEQNDILTRLDALEKAQELNE